MLLVAVPCIKEAPASNPTKIPRIVVGSLSKLPSAGRQILLVRLFETSRFWGCSYNVQQRQSACKACETAGNSFINFSLQQHNQGLIKVERILEFITFYQNAFRHEQLK